MRDDFFWVEMTKEKRKNNIFKRTKRNFVFIFKICCENQSDLFFSLNLDTWLYEKIEQEIKKNCTLTTIWCTAFYFNFFLVFCIESIRSYTKSNFVSLSLSKWNTIYLQIWSEVICAHKKPTKTLTLTCGLKKEETFRKITAK